MAFLKNTDLSRKTSQVSANWGRWDIVKKLHSEAVSSFPVQHKTVPYPGTMGLSYRERGMKTRTHCTGMKGLEIHANPATQKHTGKARFGVLDVHRQEAVCLMPVFFHEG